MPEVRLCCEIGDLFKVGHPNPIAHRLGRSGLRLTPYQSRLRTVTESLCGRMDVHGVVKWKQIG